MTKQRELCPRCAGTMCADFELLFGHLVVCLSCGYRIYPSYKDEIQNLIHNIYPNGAADISASNTGSNLVNPETSSQQISKVKTRKKQRSK